LAATPPPFARHEWMIALRYLRARRFEGGIGAMTWISLIGIALAVAALIITLAVRSGFRHEFIDTILGVNAHVTVYNSAVLSDSGRLYRTMEDYDERAGAIRVVPGVTGVTPLIRGQVMASHRERNTGADVYGIRADDLMKISRVADSPEARGEIGRFAEGVAVGSLVAIELGLDLGDSITLVLPNGVATPLGRSPRVNTYEVVYIFTAGRYDVDRTRVYMPFVEAQAYFNREGVADELAVTVANPEMIDDLRASLLRAGGDRTLLWTWRDSSGAFLRALDIEDNVMFVILFVLVSIATMNIVSGLIMLVMNKGGDIGILRTMGLTEGAVLRIFFLCGACIGIAGTVLGTILGCLFSIHIDRIFSLVNYIAGGGVWDPSIRGIYELPARLEGGDVVSAVALSLGLSFIVTIFPARRAARMNPVDALRYE